MGEIARAVLSNREISASLSLIEKPLLLVQAAQHLEICRPKKKSGALFCRELYKPNSRVSHLSQPAANLKAAQWSFTEPFWFSEQHILPFTLQAMNGNPPPQITLLISTERDQECTWPSVLPVQILVIATWRVSWAQLVTGTHLADMLKPRKNRCLFF